MNDLSVAPDLLASAAGDLAAIRSGINEAAAAASPTSAVAAPAADEVSIAVTALFNEAAQEFQALTAQASAFHQGFIGLMNEAAAAYANAEATAQRQLFGTPGRPHIVGLGENLLSFQTGGRPGFSVSSSIPVNVLLDLTNTGLPVIGPLLNQWAMEAVGTSNWL